MHAALILGLGLIATAYAGQEAVAVEGILLCDGKPADKVLVKLYEEDKLIDDKLASGYTDHNGHFKLSGTQSEWGGISTKFNVYHKCGTLPFLKRFIPTCTFKASFDIPSNYISSGTVASRVYNAQIMELSLHRSNTDCFH